MRTTRPSTRSTSPALATRMVSVFISRVARVRSRPSSSVLMAKFIAASSSTEWTPACTMPWGLHAIAVGAHDAIEDALAEVGGDAWAVVAHGDLPGLGRQLGVAAVLHGVVDEQVQGL